MMCHIKLKRYKQMKTFTEFLNESDTPVIKVKKATTAMRKKGETYVVHDGDFNIVKFNGKDVVDVQRSSAKEIAATNPNWKVASTAFWHDNKK